MLADLIEQQERALLTTDVRTSSEHLRRLLTDVFLKSAVPDACYIGRHLPPRWTSARFKSPYPTSHWRPFKTTSSWPRIGPKTTPPDASPCAVRFG